MCSFCNACPHHSLKFLILLNHLLFKGYVKLLLEKSGCALQERRRSSRDEMITLKFDNAVSFSRGLFPVASV